MTRISKLFFLVGATFAVMGMIWGVLMSASGDHSLSPAHGHLMLIGFVVMSAFGGFYSLNPRAAANRWAQVHLGLSALSVLILVPGIAMAITGQGEVLAKIGSVLVILSMLLFWVTVARAKAVDP